MHIQDITGVVLAGGRGTRMGTLDKGLQLLDGKPLALHVAQRLLPQVGRLAINANQNPARYREFGFPVWPDRMPGFPGPLAGLHAALTACETPYLISAPCDSPFIPPDLVAHLAAALAREQGQAAVVATGTPGSLHRQPVFCLLQTALAAQLEQWLANGGRKVDQWLQHCRAIEVRFDDEAAFRNINTLDDLRQSAQAGPSAQAAPDAQS